MSGLPLQADLGASSPLVSEAPKADVRVLRQNPALFRILFTTTRLAASNAGTRQSAIGLDDAHQEIEKDFLLFSGKRRENTHLSRDHRRPAISHKASLSSA